MHVLDLGYGAGTATLEIASRLEGAGRLVGLDLSEKMLGERAHVGSTTSQGLRQLLVSAGFSEVEVEVARLNWFWGIMIGKGVKRT